MNTTDKIKKIIAKIAHLRELASKAGTQAEAESAAKMAERLIAQYEIEEADLEAAGSQEAEEVGEGDLLHAYEGHNAERWRGTLACGLARVHGCYSFQDRAGAKAVQRIAGRPSSVAIVRYLFGWLCYEIERLSQRERGRAARHAFKMGAVVGYLAVLRKAQQEATAVQQTTSAQSFGLVVSNRTEEAQRYMEKALHTKFTTTRARVSDGGAFGRGREAGSSLSTGAGLNGGRPLPALGR